MHSCADTLKMRPFRPPALPPRSRSLGLSMACGSGSWTCLATPPMRTATSPAQRWERHGQRIQHMSASDADLAWAVLACGYVLGTGVWRKHAGAASPGARAARPSGGVAGPALQRHRTPAQHSHSAQRPGNAAVSRLCSVTGEPKPMHPRCNICSSQASKSDHRSCALQGVAAILPESAARARHIRGRADISSGWSRAGRPRTLSCGCGDDGNGASAAQAT